MFQLLDDKLKSESDANDERVKAKLHNRFSIFIPDMGNSDDDDGDVFTVGDIEEGYLNPENIKKKQSLGSSSSRHQSLRLESSSSVKSRSPSLLRHHRNASNPTDLSSNSSDKNN